MPTVVGVYNEWAIFIAMVGQTVAILFLIFKVREVHITFNSKMDRLLKITGDEGFLRGQQHEREDHDKRTRERENESKAWEPDREKNAGPS